MVTSGKNLRISAPLLTKTASGRTVAKLVSLLGVYANAEKVVLTHEPALKRAQRGDVVAAIATKDAQAAANSAKEAKLKCKSSRLSR